MCPDESEAPHTLSGWHLVRIRFLKRDELCSFTTQFCAFMDYINSVVAVALRPVDV